MNFMPEKTPKRSLLRIAGPLILLLLLWTTACEERTDTEGGLEADTTMMEQDTAGAMMDTVSADTAALGPGEADLDSTLSLLERPDITDVPLNRAISLIGAWQQELRQSGQENLSSIADDLDALESELMNQPMDGQSIGEIMTRLGEQTAQVAETDAEGTMAEQLQRLGNLLSQAGNQLTGGEAASAE